MELIKVEENWRYPSHNGKGGTAYLRIYGDSDGGYVAIVTARFDNEGTSIVFAAWHIHRELSAELRCADFVHVQQQYPEPATLTRAFPHSAEQELDVVNIARQADQDWGEPHWQRLTPAALKKLIGAVPDDLDPMPRSVGRDVMRLSV